MPYGKMTVAALGLAFAMCAPASAQMASGAMNSDHMAMSRADMAMMKKCQKMSHSAMMKNRRCAAMMKAHPDMMQGGMMHH